MTCGFGVSELIKCLRGEDFHESAQIFQTMSNSFKLHPKPFPRGAKNIPAPLIYGHAFLFIFILFNGKRQQARAWGAICRDQLRQYDSKNSTYRGEKRYINKSVINKDAKRGHAWGPIAPQSRHLSRQTKPFQPSQSKVLCTKERDDIRMQTKNVRTPVVFGLYCPSSQNLIKKFCMKSR